VALKHHYPNTVPVLIFLCEVRQLGYPIDKKKKMKMTIQQMFTFDWKIKMATVTGKGFKMEHMGK
jgi:hypothetical protein